MHGKWYTDYRSFLLLLVDFFFFLLVFSNVGVVLVNLKKSYLFPIDIYRITKQ